MSQARDSVPNQASYSMRENAIEVQHPAESTFDVLPPFPQIFSFEGRMNRTNFTSIQIILVLAVLMVAATADGILSGGLEDILTIATPLVHRHARPDLVDFFDRIGGGDPLRVVIGVVCAFGWWLLGFSATVRRFHDFGRSGWLVVGLNLASQIPYVGWVLVLIPFLTPGTEGSNEYGERPKPARLWARVRHVPQHLWRGETALTNMLVFYVFFLNFLVLDKGGTTLMAGLDLSTINLLFVGALIMLNCVLAVGLWRSAMISDTGSTWRFVGKLVAVVLVTRAVFTLISVLIPGSAPLG